MSKVPFGKKIVGVARRRIVAHQAPTKARSSVASKPNKHLTPVNYWHRSRYRCNAEGTALAQHRALGRVTSGTNPPNNLILEEAAFSNVAEAVPVLLPFVAGGSGFTA